MNSKVLLHWDIGASHSCPEAVKERFKARYAHAINQEGLVQIMAQESRSQKANIDSCIEKLHEMINSVARPPKIRKATKPKRSAVLKRLSSKKKDSEKKQLRRKDY